MKLKKEIIERIKGNKDAMPALEVALKKNDLQYIRIMVKRNADNSPLTTLAALTALQNVLGIEDVNDMVDRSSATWL